MTTLLSTCLHNHCVLPLLACHPPFALPTLHTLPHNQPPAPNLAALGSTDIKVLMGLASVVPIILNCYVGHQSVHGIMGMLKPYSAGTTVLLVGVLLSVFDFAACVSACSLGLVVAGKLLPCLFFCCIHLPCSLCTQLSCLCHTYLHLPVHLPSLSTTNIKQPR